MGRTQVAVAAGLTLLLAFLLASFPAANSDVWRHLATGRALVSGTYSFGSDPFAYTTDGVTWVNQAWLSDLLLYALHQCFGERLVFFKATLVIALAALMLLAAGAAKHPWTASLTVAVGLVAIGPHLILAPQVVSYLLFGFTLWWLYRTDEIDWSLRANWPLFVAFVLWANCDEWFLLGPMAVGLIALGRLRGADGPRGPVTLVLVALAICVLNPHHVGIFSVPAAISDSSESGFGSLLSAQWSRIPAPSIGYALVIALSLLSLLRTRSNDWSAVLCFAMLCLSLFRTSAIPFFTIAACPLIARLGGSLALPAQDAPAGMRRFAWAGPTAAIVVLAALVVSACPGWLQGTFEPRGWHLRADPSMKRIAEELAEWRRIGQFGENSRTFTSSVDLAHHLEWFCPGEKVFLDGRANLFPAQVVEEHETVSAALMPEARSAKAGGAWADLDAVLGRWQVTHLVVADPVDRRLVTALRNLWRRPDEWSLVAVQGRTTVFTRTRHMVARLPAVDLDRRAFDPALAGIGPGPGREPQPRQWWDCFTWSEPKGALDRDEATIALMHFDALGPAFAERHRRIWQAEMIAAQFGTIAPQSSIGQALADGYLFAICSASQLSAQAQGPPTPLDIFSFQMIVAHRQNSDDGPPGSLLVSVRAARRSLQANPDDALAHLALGRGYVLLQRHTAERGVGARLPLFKELRRVQALVALKRAVQLKPDLLAAHELLADLYQEARGFDLALPHVHAHLRLARSAGPRLNETAEQFAARIERLTGQEQQLGKQVRELLNRVDAQSFKLDAYGKARLAEDHGLPAYALEQLLRSSYGEIGVQGAVTQLHLLLHAGRTADFRMMIEPGQESKMGSFNYRWLQTLLAAADGDYDEADAHLQRLVATTVDLPNFFKRSVPPDAAVAVVFGQQMLNGGSLDPQQVIVQCAPLTFGPWQAPESQTLFVQGLDRLADTARKDADRHALRGVLLLESGAIAPAELAFRAALAAWNGDGGSTLLARHYLELMGKK